MARITVEDCLSQVGNENRFSLIHLAVERLKQHRDGQPMLVKGKNKEVVMTLREIAAGMISFDNIHDFAVKKDKKQTPAPAIEAITEETEKA
ncbi:MAG: DNA-directed RNA polymerase subunit omega [Proteobacteria bacterium]|nr:DNA-directed RNA polymerase subunit omega [Pseudomonadota bacterium]MBU1708860.1 DNA-directed RNA polymerase subunit omega [Pseudomonadota bacterium]